MCFDTNEFQLENKIDSRSLLNHNIICTYKFFK